MTTEKKGNGKAAAASKATGKWEAPADATKAELSEFAKWDDIGDVVIGRITSTGERPDPEHAGKIMRHVILSPAVIYPKGDKESAEVYHSLAVGLSAHLGLLLGNPDKEIGQAVAIRYDSDRPSLTRGKKPSRQFDLYRISEPTLRKEIESVAGEAADGLPF